jgi:hypothetical protein
MRRPRFRCPAPPAPADVSVRHVLAQDCPPRAPTPASDDAWAALRRLLAEALILQDSAEELVINLRKRPDPADVARPCGRLNGRFVQMRDAMPPCGDPEMDRYTAELRQILDHHILFLKTSLGFLAGEGRCELLAERLDALDGLGGPAQRLEAIRAEILLRTSPGGSSPGGGTVDAGARLATSDRHAGSG